MGTGAGPNFGNTGGSRSSATIRAYSKERVKNWAEKKRSELTGKTKKNFNTACVVYDSETGKYYYGRNGGYHEKDGLINPHRTPSMECPHNQGINDQSLSFCG